MAFAGLWEVWHDKENPDAEPLRTCVILHRRQLSDETHT